MKRMILNLLGSISLTLVATAVLGQEGPVDRVAVAFSDPSRPGFLQAGLITGSITVKGYKGDEVIVEARTRTKNYTRKKSDSKGMRRLAIRSTGLTVEEQHNEMKISAASHMRAIDLNIQVPTNTSLKLSTINSGRIIVEDVQGEIELNNTNGSIEAYDISGSVVANTTNGKVKVTFDSVRSKKPMSFVSFNGNVDVTFPEDIKANVKMKSDQGEIYSDFDIKITDQPRLIQEDTRKRGGKYRVKVESAVYGTINGGGPEYRFSTYNGSIYIRQKK